MNQTLHIIAKDVRHLRWGLAGWAVIVAAHVAIDVARPSMELQGEGVAIVAAQLASLTSLIELVTMGLIVSWLVHEDPPVGREAFWLTRPIDARRLMVAKLSVAGALFVLLPLAAELVTMAAFRVGARDMWRAAPATLLVQAESVLLLTAAATLTPSITRYAVVILGAAGVYILFVSATIAGLLLSTAQISPSPRPVVIDPTPTVVGNALAVGVSLWVVLYQYRHRRLKTAATLAGAGLAMTIAVPMFWPWHARRPDPDPGTWARDEMRAAAVFDPQPPNVSDETRFDRRNSARKQIAARVRLTGMPDDLFVRSVDVRARLELPGATLLSTQSEGVSVRHAVAPRATPDRLRPLQAALGNTRLMDWDLEQDYEMWPVLLLVTDQEFAHYAHTPGHLTAALDFHLERPTVAETVRLDPGQSFTEDRRRFEIVRVNRRVDSCTVWLREISIPVLRPRVDEPEQFVLRNPSRGEVVLGDPELFARGTNSWLPVLVNITLGGSGGVSESAETGTGVTVRNYGVRYPRRDPSASTRPVIDAAWLEGAELVRVVTRYAGHVARSLTIDDFKMTE